MSWQVICDTYYIGNPNGPRFTWRTPRVPTKREATEVARAIRSGCDRRALATWIADPSTIRIVKREQ